MYGRNAVRESLRANRRRFAELVVSAGVTGSEGPRKIVETAQRLGATVRETGRDELDRLVSGANHQGVVLRTTPYPYASAGELLPVAPTSMYLVLDSLQDPQNLGSLLRSAEAAGVQGVLLPEHRAAGVSPAVVNASAGAAEHLRIVTVPNLARAIETLQAEGVWAVGLEAVDRATPLWETRLDGPLAIVVGSEGEGIRRLVLERCDFVVSLPVLGHVGSLNAAVAGSIAVYEVLRRRTVSSARG
ncbi:MAG: 23S rRNA (guanosine(2251)-2'-O)-methyltransferase RlmB [Chloroflexota bacterium]|nr:23S rRNA (guanosine(2251)-2'-O)-methyltransferase RlmB [Chloroflexota bacterium]